MKCIRRQIRLLSCGLLLAGIAGASSSVLAANTNNNYRQSGDSVDATWYTSDSCTSTYVYVSASNNVTTGSTPSQQVYFNSQQNNFCTGAWTFTNGYGPGGIQLSAQGGRSANLVGSIPTSECGWDISTYSYICTNGVVDFNLNWSATENPSRSRYTTSNHSPSGIYQYRSVGTSAPALATGTIKQNGAVDLISGSSQYGAIVTSDNATISISRR